MKKKTSVIWRISKKDLEKRTKESSTIAEVLRSFGLYNKGGNYKTLKKRLDDDEIDYSHIPLGRQARKGRKFGGVGKISLDEIMVKNSTYNRFHLKNRLLKNGILKNECSICDQGPEWNGKSLVMVLDHINGISNDHRLKNLRMVCPQCNSQLPTFCGRHNKKIKYHCKDCGGEISRNAKKCNKCVSKKKGLKNRKVKNRPSKEKILEMKKTMSMCAIGRKYGVSDNAVRKWIK